MSLWFKSMWSEAKTYVYPNMACLGSVVFELLESENVDLVAELMSGQGFKLVI